MIVKVVYPDGTWFIGDRSRKAIGLLVNHETVGTHHYYVVSGTSEFDPLVGQELSVPVNRAKYYVLNNPMVKRKK